MLKEYLMMLVDLEYLNDFEISLESFVIVFIDRGFVRIILVFIEMEDVFLLFEEEGSVILVVNF